MENNQVSLEEIEAAVEKVWKTRTPRKLEVELFLCTKKHAEMFHKAMKEHALTKYGYDYGK